MKKNMLRKKSKINCCDCKLKTNKKRSKKRSDKGKGKGKGKGNVFSYKKDRFIPSSVNKENFLSSPKKSPKKSPKNKSKSSGRMPQIYGLGLNEMHLMR